MAVRCDKALITCGGLRNAVSGRGLRRGVLVRRVKGRLRMRVRPPALGGAGRELGLCGGPAACYRSGVNVMSSTALCGPPPFQLKAPYGRSLCGSLSYD